MNNDQITERVNELLKSMRENALDSGRSHCRFQSRLGHGYVGIAISGFVTGMSERWYINDSPTTESEARLFWERELWGILATGEQPLNIIWVRLMMEHAPLNVFEHLVPYDDKPVPPGINHHIREHRTRIVTYGPQHYCSQYLINGVVIISTSHKGYYQAEKDALQLAYQEKFNYFQAY